MKPCPYCKRKVKDAAEECRYCGRDLVPVSARAGGAGVAALLSLVIPGAGQMRVQGVGIGVLWLVTALVGYWLFVPLGLVIHLLSVLLAATVGGERTPIRRGVETKRPARAANATPLGAASLVGPVLFGVVALEILFLLPWLAGY